MHFICVFCIATHGIFNSLGAFANNEGLDDQKIIIMSLLLVLIGGSYAIYIALMFKKDEKNKK